MGQMGSADPPGEMDEKLKAKTCKKEQFSMFMLYFESNQGRQAVVYWGEYAGIRRIPTSGFFFDSVYSPQRS